MEKCSKVYFCIFKHAKASIGAIFTVYAAKFVPLIFLLLADLIRFGKYIFHKFRKTTSSSPTSGISRLNFLKKLGFAGGGLMLATMFTGMVKWVYDFKIHDVKVRIPNLASAFNNYKIVQLSDMHLGSWASMRSMHELIDIINKLKPDLIVFTGDLVNYATPEAYRFKKSLSQLKAKDGIYAILGNHDYGDYTHWDSKEAKAKNLQNLVDFYQDIRWNLLRNNAVHIQKGQDSFVLAGVENWGNALRFPKYGDLNKTFENIDNTNKATILLSHDPSHWEAQVLKFEKQIDLMLAGHTHGMQFGVEIPGIKWSPAKWIYKQWGGLYKQKNALGNDGLLYVNRGIGSIGYPGRVGILPEITLIALETGS